MNRGNKAQLTSTMRVTSVVMRRTMRAGPARRAASAAAVLAVGCAATAGCARARGRRLRFRRGGRSKPRSSVEAIFDDLDRDGSGEIDEEEIREGLKHLGLPSGDDYVSDLLGGGLDVDKSKTVTKAEFVEYVKSKEKEMLKVFNDLDKDGSGTITGDEVVESMRRMGIDASDADGARMVELLDENKDGVVTFEEFKKYTSLLPAAQLRSNAAYCWMGSSVDRSVVAPRQRNAMRPCRPPLPSSLSDLLTLLFLSSGVLAG